LDPLKGSGELIISAFSKVSLHDSTVVFNSPHPSGREAELLSFFVLRFFISVLFEDNLAVPQKKKKKEICYG
jgi:hypothetical protein